MRRNVSTASPSRDSPGHGHERRDVRFVEAVEVERDVDAVDLVEGVVDGVLARVDAGVADELALGWVEVAHAEQRNLCGIDRAGVEDHPQRHAPLVAGRRAFGRVQVAVRVDPDDPEPVVSGCEPLDRADVRAAAAAQNEGALGQLGSEGEDLIRERFLGDDSCLGIREIGESGLRHRLAALAPGARHANESGGELAAARVALVLGAHRDGSERPAVRALRAQARHG